jgi:hypothetical protein
VSVCGFVCTHKCVNGLGLSLWKEKKKREREGRMPVGAALEPE